jgi:squalene-hopene/tetraprenyl-beta-curcumene cyclase
MPSPWMVTPVALWRADLPMNIEPRHMSKPLITLVLGLLTASAGLCADTAAMAESGPAKGAAPADIEAAIERGLAYLLKAQNSNGWWSTPAQPAVTALALTAFNLEPTGRFQRSRPSELLRGYDFILSSALPDGSIQRVGLANYNTSISLVALATSGDPNYLPVILAARRYIAGSQIDFGTRGTNDTIYDGGVGYGTKYQHSDMNNTLTALDAMRISEATLPRDNPDLVAQNADLNWDAVAHFLQHCQNLPGVNTNDWVSPDPKDRGGFVYYPGNSMAGGVTNQETGRVALRSYGSMSYGGLLSYIYARVDKDDPRVISVRDWLRSNYTIQENPAMGQQGYFYYLHLLTKALGALGDEHLELKGGRKVAWRNDVATRLLELQKPDGSWSNPEPRWWEADPVLVTSYAVMTLEMLHRTGKTQPR